MPSTIITNEAFTELLNKYIPSLASYVQIARPASTYLRDTLFGGPTRTTADSTIAVEFQQGGMPVAVDSKFGGPSNLVYGRNDFDAQAIRFGYVFLEAKNGLADSVTHTLGEDVLPSLNPEQRRMVAALAEKTANMNLSIDAYEEKMCAEVIFSGSATTKNAGTQIFPIESSLLSVAATTKWSDTGVTTKKIRADIMKAGLLMSKFGGVFPNRLIMNVEDVANLFEVTGEQDWVNSTIAANKVIDYEKLNEQGVAPQGTLRVPGLGLIDVVAYNGYYFASSADKASLTQTPYIPKGSAILTGPSVGYMAYGPVLAPTEYGQGKTSGKRVSTIYDIRKGAIQDFGIHLQSAPIAVPQQINSWAVLTNLS